MAEIFLECRPALIGKRHVPGSSQVRLHELLEGAFVLGHFLQQIRIGIALAQFLRYLPAARFTSGSPFSACTRSRKIQFAVFHDLDTQVEQRLNRRVAGQKIKRPRTEGNDLQIADAEDSARHRQKLRQHRGDIFRISDGVFRNVRPEAPQSDVVGCAEQSAIGVAAAIDQVFAAIFRGRHEHDRAGKSLGQQRRGPFRAEIAQVDRQRVDAFLLHLVQGFEHILLILDDRFDLDDRHVELPAGGNHVAPALAAKARSGNSPG